MQNLYFDAFQVILLFVAVLLVRPRSPLHLQFTNMTGKLPNLRRKIALARRRAAGNHVSDYSCCGLVRFSPEVSGLRTNLTGSTLRTSEATSHRVDDYPRRYFVSWP